MKGLFIPEITAEMFRNGCLESIETLMAEGEIYDIDYQQPCEDAISRKALIERINQAEENFKADHIESISSGDDDPFVDGVLSGVFNLRQMVAQAPAITESEVEDVPVPGQ